MGRPDFRQPETPLVPHHLHGDGDSIKGMQHGLPAEPEVGAELGEREPANPLGFLWRVPLSWVHNPSSVLVLFRYRLNAQTHD